MKTRITELTMQLRFACSRMAKPEVTAINGAAKGGGAALARGREANKRMRAFRKP